jgi:hypothetical protein
MKTTPSRVEKDFHFLRKSRYTEATRRKQASQGHMAPSTFHPFDGCAGFSTPAGLALGRDDKKSMQCEKAADHHGLWEESVLLFLSQNVTHMHPNCQREKGEKCKRPMQGNDLEIAHDGNDRTAGRKFDVHFALIFFPQSQLHSPAAAVPVPFLVSLNSSCECILCSPE